MHRTRLARRTQRALIALAVALALALPALRPAGAAGAATAAQAVAGGPFPVGTIIVADSGRNQVVVAPPGGVPTYTIGTGLNAPRGVAVDRTGNVYIADTGNRRVVRVPADGGPQTEVGVDLNAAGVAVTSTNDVLIADGDRVVRVPADGGPQSTVGTGFGWVRGIAADWAGNVYVADNLEHSVVVVPADGGPQTRVGMGLTLPTGVAVTVAGDVLAAHSFGIDKIAAGGGAQTRLATVWNAGGVAVDAAGNVLVGDTLRDRVVRVGADGRNPTAVVTWLGTAQGVAVFAPAPTFTADTPPSTATVGSGYSYTYRADTPAGEPAARFLLADGTLPPGLSLDPDTGVLAGTPTAPGSYTFRVMTANVVNATLAPPATITVAKAAQATSIALTPAAPNGDNGWYIYVVGVAVTATDASDASATRCVLDPPSVPVAFADLPSGTCPYAPGLAWVGGDGMHTVYAASQDSDGDAGSPVSASFAIDTTQPDVTCTLPLPGAWFPVAGAASGSGAGASKPSLVTAGVRDATSGPAGSTLLSAVVDTSTAGLRWVTFSAKDRAGNITFARCRAVVGYVFGGFASPAPDTAVAAGGALPVSFTLLDASGQPISDAEAAGLAANPYAFRIRLADVAGGAAGRVTYDPATKQFQTTLTTSAQATGPNALSVTVTVGAAIVTTSGTLAFTVT
jgi:hypothetical protein